MGLQSDLIQSALMGKLSELNLKMPSVMPSVTKTQKLERCENPEASALVGTASFLRVRRLTVAAGLYHQYCNGYSL